MAHEDRIKQFLDELAAAANHRHMVDVFNDAVSMMADALWSPFSGPSRDSVEAHWQEARGRFTDEQYQHVLAARRRYAKKVARSMVDAEFYADWRAFKRMCRARRNLRRGRMYSPCPSTRIPDWACRGERTIDPRSAWLAMNNTAAHRCYAMMLAVERKEQMRRRRAR